ncbi:MAG: hypothetical protein WBA73_07985 [Devosia sp.]|jgi:hypothetical protein
MSRKMLAPLAIVLALALAACGDAPDNSTAPPADPAAPATTPADPVAPPPA